MAFLTKEEILAGLRKLGISSTSELDSYFREYNEYLTLENIWHSPREYPKKMKRSYSRHHVMASRSARISNSFVSSVDSRAFAKAKPSRRMK